MKKIIFLLFLAVYIGKASGQSTDEKHIIGNILIEGNKKTREHIITRELSFNIGESYTRAELDSMFIWNRNRVYNTNLFNTVSISTVNESADELDVLIRVEERWYFYPVPIFKLIDRNFNDWWVNRNRDLSRVNYGVRVTQFNFRGRSEVLRATAQFGFNTHLNLAYAAPYIDKKQKHGISVLVNYLNTKNLAYTTHENVRRFISSEDRLRTLVHASIQHSFRNSFFSFHRTTIGFYHTSVADTIMALNQNYLVEGTEQNYFYAGYGFRWDRRDNRNYPTSGEWYRATITKYGLGILGDEVDYWRIILRLTKYYDLGNNWFFATGFNGLTSFPAERDYFNYFAVGFIGSRFRGHDLNIIEGSSYALQQNEIKYKIFSNSYDISGFMPIRQFQTFPVHIFGKLFFDQGYVRGYPNYTGSDLLDDQYVYSYGTGIDLMLVNDAVFRFELSRNTLGQTNFFINFLAYL